MLKIDKGESQIDGRVIDIISEYTALGHHIRKAFKEKGVPDKFVDDLFVKVIEYSKMSDDELSQMKRELEVQMMMKLFK